MIKNNKESSMKTQRVSAYPIEDLILHRWSARAFSGEPITEQQLKSLFEAARWAPSSYNGQPWRFVYAMRDTPAWNRLFDLMVAFNQQWSKNAAALVLIVSRNNFEFNGKPARTHSFDTGAAVQNFSLQATAMGLIAHGMEGFDYDRARKDLNIPEGYTVEALFAVGNPGDVHNLPETMQKVEQPSDRKKVEEFIAEGVFPWSS